MSRSRRRCRSQTNSSASADEPSGGEHRSNAVLESIRSGDQRRRSVAVDVRAAVLDDVEKARDMARLLRKDLANRGEGFFHRRGEHRACNFRMTTCHDATAVEFSAEGAQGLQQLQGASAGASRREGDTPVAVAIQVKTGQAADAQSSVGGALLITVDGRVRHNRVVQEEDDVGKRPGLRAVVQPHLRITVASGRQLDAVRHLGLHDCRDGDGGHWSGGDSGGSGSSRCRATGGLLGSAATTATMLRALSSGRHRRVNHRRRWWCCNVAVTRGDDGSVRAAADLHPQHRCCHQL
jgi:hypothetical protein